MVLGDTDSLIEKDKLRLENMKLIHLNQLKQTTTINEVKIDGSRALVTARLENGKDVPIMDSQLSRIFGLGV